MKKTLVTILIFFCLFVANAQVRWGAKAGYSLTDIITNVNLSQGYSSKSGFNLGAFFNVRLSKHFRFQQELMYSLQGAATNGWTTNSADPYTPILVPATQNYHYINAAALIQYVFSPGLFLETGIQPGFSLGGTYAYQGGNSFTESPFPIDFSFVFGSGYQFPRSGLGIDARYNVGTINAATAWSGGPTPNEKNRVFQIGVFYKFARMAR